MIKDEIDVDGSLINTLDMMNVSGTFNNGVRMKEYSMKDIPAFSGKLIPEFDKRRSIKDMFGRRPSGKSTPTASLDESTVASSAEQVPPVEPEVISLPPSTVPKLKEAFQPASGDKKRSAPSINNSRTLKRTKSGCTAGGQSSLMGFFKPKLPMDPPVGKDQTEHKSPAASPTKSTAGMERAATPPNHGDDAVSVASTAESPHASQRAQSIPQSPVQIVDPIVSKESWGKLFSRPAAPRCEGHEEPCKTMKTRKPGFNCGREFWMCARYVIILMSSQGAF